jgi:hypothetical protein
MRFMIYDAIVSGARALAFYGGQNPKCWGQLDAAGGWNWTFWERVLEPLVRELSGPINAALVNPGSTRELPTSNRAVRAIRRGEWVIATSSADAGEVTIDGVPGGSITDTFGRWSVHVYRRASSTARSS